MSISVLLAVIGQGIIEFGIHVFGGKTSSNETWLIGLVLIVLVITTGMLSNLYKSVAELKSRAGLSIRDAIIGLIWPRALPKGIGRLARCIPPVFM